MSMHQQRNGEKNFMCMHQRGELAKIMLNKKQKLQKGMYPMKSLM